MQTGTIWIIAGYSIIAGGLFLGSLIVHYGNRINQQISEQNILDKQKNSENIITNQIKELKNEVVKLQKVNEKELSSQFSGGYQLFGVINKQIIPSAKPSTEAIKISWSNARILNITNDFIDIVLPDAVFPGNNILNNIAIRVKNEEGFVSQGTIVVSGWASFVKILKSDKGKIIAVVGYRKIENLKK
ncbi:MAG: hypothetical protein NT145_05390 [Elusimicrobia bacterium]|nr:hypothetical protein [Elusimicrobiota bacterium]